MADEDDIVPDELEGRSARTLVLNSQEVSAIIGDVDDIQKNISSIWDVLNNPKPTAAQMAVKYAMKDKYTMAIASAFILALTLGVLAIFTGTSATINPGGGVTIGSCEQPAE